jgi:transporter family-2 protein
MLQFTDIAWEGVALQCQDGIRGESGRHGLIGAVQVYAGLTLVNKVGAGLFVGFTVTAALITSLLIDHFGWFRMQLHPLSAGRIIGGLLLVGGVTLVATF